MDVPRKINDYQRFTDAKWLVLDSEGVPDECVGEEVQWGQRLDNNRNALKGRTVPGKNQGIEEQR